MSSGPSEMSVLAWEDTSRTSRQRWPGRQLCRKTSLEVSADSPADNLNFKHKHKVDVTYSRAVVVLQETQVDLAMQVDGCVVGKGEHPERESGRSGDTILDQLYRIICWIRTPGRRGVVKITILSGELWCKVTWAAWKREDGGKGLFFCRWLGIKTKKNQHAKKGWSY